MSSADKLKHFFKKSELSINPDSDEKVFQDVFDAHQKTIKNKPAKPVNIARIIMKSHFAKIAATAVVITTCIIGLTMFNKTSSIALANVLTKIEQVNAFTYKQDIIISINNENNDNFTQVISNVMKSNTPSKYSTVLISKGYGSKEVSEITKHGNQNSTIEEEFILVKEKVMITISHAEKSYIRKELNDEQLEKLKKENFDLHTTIEELLEHNFTKLDTTTIDNIKVEGFQSTDPNFFQGLFSDLEIKLWIDVEKLLPVRMEIKFGMGDTVTISANCVLHDFKWDVPASASDFKPVIPDDYTLSTGDSDNAITTDEKTVVEGLQCFVDFTGSYPNQLNPMAILEIVQEINNKPITQQNLIDELQGLSSEQATQIFREKISAMLESAKFYYKLFNEKKDPAYYGNVVSPGDADNVLMRWKVSDNDYKVIFGDLRAETVSYETLIELEKELSK